MSTNTNRIDLSINHYTLSFGFEPNHPLFKFDRYPTATKDVAAYLRKLADALETDYGRANIPPFRFES